MTRVLVVDDREENAYYLQALLTGHGFDVRTACHGAEALVKARQEAPDLVISDLLMPVMDGYTLLRQWRNDEHFRDIPFIVYTATYTDPEDERLALSLGADAFILKPAEPDDFVARARELLARGRVQLPQLEGPPGENTLLKQYSETLIRKLEQKSLELEEANQRLQADIVARQGVERALRESEERFRQMAENIEDVFWLAELDGKRFHYVSPAYDAIFGWSRSRLLESPAAWLDVVHPDDVERIRHSLARLGDGKWDETYRVIRPDGAIVWIKARAYPVRDQQGNAYRVAGVSRDITAYRELEAQLRHAQKMEALGQLAGGVAHDFNNLLTVILTYTSLVLEQLEPGSVLASDIEEAQVAGHRATELTRQLLSLGRRQLLQPKVMDVGKVVGDMDKLLRRTLGEDIDFRVSASPAVGCVLAEPGQIEQIVMNLVVNARDAMPRGGTLRVEAAPVDVHTALAGTIAGLQPGPYVCLSVSDTGMGMDATVREHMFEPFFTTKEPGRGTGLGLSTAFGIVKQGKGHIDVDSVPGQGTKMVVYLPRIEGAADTEGAALQDKSSLRGSETLLVVEDDDQVRATIQAILERNGYTVLQAANSSEAFALSEKHSRDVHLLVTDVVLPQMNGPEVARRLRETRGSLPVLYMSGFPKSASLDGELSGSATAFLLKPVTPSALLRKVRELLDGRP